MDKVLHDGKLCKKQKLIKYKVILIQKSMKRLTEEIMLQSSKFVRSYLFNLSAG